MILAHRPRTIRIGSVELSWPSRPPRSEPALNGTQMGDIDWYHTIDLGDGTVTQGFVDHRAQVQNYGLPASLAGKRCLDVATFDGFWAFEMEKRGAAEVIGIDVNSLADCDYPRNFKTEYLSAQPRTVKGLGFAYARRALRSRVQRRILSVYDLSPQTVGTFDFVFMSDLLLHLREPLRALEAIWSVTGGDAIIADAYDPALEATDEPGAIRFIGVLDGYSGLHWWLPTPSALRALLTIARFEDIEEISRFELQTRSRAVPKVVLRARHEARDMA